MSHADDLERFYAALDLLHTRQGGYRRLTECSGRLDWPRRGVYFFFEELELRASGVGFRVVRVGTHALLPTSGRTLWNRLSQHRGTLDPLGGNHRGSVFRLHVGDALLRSGQSPVAVSDTWGKGSTAPRETRERERPLEAKVSEFIGQMPFLYLGIDDAPGPDSLRGYIERNAIGLLSHNASSRLIDPPSEGWLGRYSSRETIQRSGLWNVNHVGDGWEPDFLATFEELVMTARAEIELKAKILK